MFQRPSALFSAAVIAVTSASFALTGCAHSSAAKSTTPVTTTAAAPAAGACSELPGNTVVASYGEDGKQTITLAELDSRLKEQLAKLEQQKYGASGGLQKFAQLGQPVIQELGVTVYKVNQ